MNFQLDCHTHTIASGHAYSTMNEMILSAKDKGLKLLGITEHAPMMPGTCSYIYFQNIKVIPRNQYGVMLRLGAELNILDYDGSVDLADRDIDGLDYTIASIHNIIYEVGTVAQNTRAYVKAIENPRINIIGHPDDSRVPVDFDEIVSAAKANHTLLELNNNSLNPESFRVKARDNDLIMLQKCMENKVDIIVNSDAHIIYDVGRADFAMDLLSEINFPEELIVNNSVEHFLQYIKK